MHKTTFFALCFFAISSVAALGQALPTASRIGDLQVGAGYSNANPDYSPHRFNGFLVYGTFDFRSRLGVELNFHHVSGPSSEGLYETTYEIGPRYVMHFGRFNPYVKFMLGRGVFNFPAPTGSTHPNLAFNMYAPGGGIDYRLTSRINIRGDYEAQFWPSFPPTGLSPSIISVGAAYHFR